MTWTLVPQMLIQWLVLAIVSCFVWTTAQAITLGSPVMLSKPGEPLKVEIPVKAKLEDKSSLETISIELVPKSEYDRLGISSKILDYIPSIAIRKGSSGQQIITIESDRAIEVDQDPFIDIIVGLKWANGGLAKPYTLMVGDVTKVVVRPGQTLSEIALQMTPQLSGADMDEAILALYKANPDAFTGGSIHRLIAGAELSKPDASILRSITPSEAKEFVIESNQTWIEQNAQAGQKGSGSAPSAGASKAPAGGDDRLKIGPGAGADADTRRYIEEIVVQEKALAQTKAKLAELEKNIADLQKLLDARKQSASAEISSKTTPQNDPWQALAVGLIFIAVTGILLLALVRYTRRKEEMANAEEVPQRAAAILAELDLNLEPSPPAEMPAAESLRVKLNLAKAYITIEDFAAARKAIEEILLVSNQVDPQMTISAKSLLSEINQRSDS